MKSRVARAAWIAVAVLTLAIVAGATFVARTTLASNASASGPKLAIKLDPSASNVRQGRAAFYTVRITRTKVSGAVSLSATGLPPNTTVSFTPPQTTGDSVTLKVAVAETTPIGQYALTIHAGMGALDTTAIAHLNVTALQRQPFTISGSLDRLLSPGATGYLNLALTNPNSQALKVTSILVTITSTSTSACSAAGNFTVTQYAGHYPLTIPAHATRTLAQFAIPQNHLPSVTMNDLPTNQNGCKNTRLVLSYTGSGYGQ